jgi:hypothetical protein
MLDAHDIPSFVRGGGFGGLFPGVQINAYNTRDIMVPEESVTEAVELLRDFQSQRLTADEHATPRRLGRLRNLFELLLFGWFVPGPRRPGANAETGGSSDKRTDEQ